MKVGKEYWIDLDSIYKDKDDSIYVRVYEDAYKQGEVGNALLSHFSCNGVQREHNKKLNNGLPILHKVPPKRDYGRYFCILVEKGGTTHGA